MRLIIFAGWIALACGAYAAGLEQFPTATSTSNQTAYILISIADGQGSFHARKLAAAGLLEAPAAIYVDATAGNDGTAARGTLRPFATLSNALAAVQSGDTVEIRGSFDVEAEYYEVDTATITPQLYLLGKTNVVLRGRNLPVLNSTNYGNILTIENCTNIWIEGIEFRGSTNLWSVDTDIVAAIQHRKTNYNTTVRGCVFRDIPDQAISHCWADLGRQSHKWTIQDNLFVNIGVTNHPRVSQHDGACVSGAPRDLIFTGNRTEGLIIHGVELDGSNVGEAAPPTMTNQVFGNATISGNVLQGIYGNAILCVGVNSNLINGITISGNVIAGNETCWNQYGHALIQMAGVANIAITGNYITDEARNPATAPARGILVYKSSTGYQHPSTNIIIAGNTFARMSYGACIGTSTGDADLVSGVLIGHNLFDGQGDDSIFVRASGVTINANRFHGAGRYAGTTAACVAIHDAGAGATDEIAILNNVLYDLAPTATTDYFVETQAGTPTVLIGQNRVARQQGSTPYSLGSATQLTFTNP